MPLKASILTVIQDRYDCSHKNKLCAKGYQDGEDDGTVAMDACVGGKILDWILIGSCISLHMNPIPERVTADA